MRELRVGLQLQVGTTQPVGTLAERDHDLWFEYDEAFIAAGIELSPLRLPLSRRGLLRHDAKPGVPLPGVFNDSRPDGWGLKLTHRAFQARGRAASSVSALDELAFVGSRGMGALVFEPSDHPANELAEGVDIARLARHAQRVLSGEEDIVLPRLLHAAGPSGGARPKALIALRDDGCAGLRSGEGDVLPGWSAWIVKFPRLHDDADVGRREHAWMRMAAAAGIEVPESGTLAIDGVGEAFIVRRFDRGPAGARHHVLSAAGALNVDFRTARADYEQLVRLTLALCGSHQAEAQAMFRLAAFNVAAVNEDDHLKNFAYRLDPTSHWRLAPGFDLTYSPLDVGGRWTTLGGLDREIPHGALLLLAERVGIKRAAARRILDEVTRATAAVRDHLRAARCEGPVSEAAAEAVQSATARLRG